MSVKKIVLVSLTGILFITYIFQLCFSVNASGKTVKPSAPASILTIENARSRFTLSKNGDSFVLNSKVPANTDIAEYIFSSFENIHIIDSVAKTSDENILDKYGLKKPLTVHGYSSDNRPVQTLFIGKTTSTGNQTYIKFDSDDKIYLASGNLILAFNFSENDILDYTLYSFKTDDAYKIEAYSGKISESNKILSLEKTGEVASVAWTNFDKPCDFDAVQEWIKSIDTLKAEEWVEDIATVDAALVPDVTFVIGAAGRNITIKMFNTDTDRVLCLCSENDYLCYISNDSYSRFFNTGF